VLKNGKREDPAFGRPVVIILTRQQASETRDASLSWADALLSKPLDFDRFHRMIKGLEKRIRPADAV
jgi:DNA-binding response OmpR family regulator